ncbi:MAG: 23S rRNA (uracil(1939)-C(5))-methyltransferase RlmD [Erysipelotrichaceae bacterium]|nr:23S rRNA (uracil(1939)-C(5))-methyltransferase RlmD [Erysipelotrichaceae bacterium]
MKNSIHILECTDLSSEGYGVCHLDSLVVFVKEMIIGDVAKVKIISYKKKYAFGIIEELLEFSDERVDSECDVAYKCGGCKLRHLSYKGQLAFKQRLLNNIFNRIYQLDLEIGEVNGSSLKAYRNKVQIPINNHKMGYYRSNSHDIVEFDYCFIQDKLINKIIAFFKKYILLDDEAIIFKHLFIRRFSSTDEVMLAFIVDDDRRNYLDRISNLLVVNFPMIKSIILNVNKRKDNVIINYDYQDVVLYGRDYIIDRVNDIEYHVSFKSFYQINPEIMIKIYDEVLRIVETFDKPKILDLYSGIGTIGIYVAKSASRVLGIEIIDDAVKNAKHNAVINKFDNVEFMVLDAKDTKADFLDDIDIVIVDPPRKGLDDELKNTLINKNVRNIIYVSCNPMSLARDLKFFKEYNYEIGTIKAYDMFPFSVHCEVVVFLSKTKA